VAFKYSATLGALIGVHVPQSLVRDIAWRSSNPWFVGFAFAMVFVVILQVFTIRLQTQRERVRRQAMESQRLEYVGKLASGVAHDFNNVLMAISAACENLRRSQGSSQSTETILHAVEHARTVVEQLLSTSSHKAEANLFIDMRGELLALRSTLLPLLGDDVVIDLMTEERDYWTAIDKASFEQIVLNLAVNAREAMPDGGTLTVSIAPGALSSHGDSWTLSVADNGHGMASELVAKIFEPFFTTKISSGGTGLGLATVRQLVDAHCGSIDVDSAEGSGTRFTVTLPAADPPKRDKRVEHRATPRSNLADENSSAKRILLVDDDELVRRAMVGLMLDAGFVVRSASNGVDALEVLSSWTPDLVLSDLAMPVMGGRELSKRLAVEYPNLPVLLMSGYADDEESSEALARQHLRKPFSVEELESRVTSMLS
jgi:signal transduction histidine kinase/CheY-like chemotaxis protein